MANQAYAVKLAVRDAMHAPAAGISREIMRGLLARQNLLATIQFWLQRAALHPYLEVHK